jgi:glutaredoxin
MALRARAVLFVLTAAAASIATPAADAAPSVSSLASAPVTVYGAKWCSACRALESGLADRKIAFEIVDVDDNPSAFARARAAAGTSNAIPLTSVAKSSATVWIVGANVDAVEHALKD